MNIRSNDNPWIGLDSYREGQILYGRSREIQDLSMAVFYNRQTVVYGRSGMGKSSLLHAGIFPEARRRGCLPISIRLDHSAETTYRDQLIHAITDAVVAAGGEITDLHNDRPAPQSLWEFFHRYQPRLNGDIVTPLIVIDQFEEIFTLSHNTQRVKAFFEELADFFNDVMPAYLQNDSQSFAVTETGNNLFDGLAINLSEQQFGEEMSCHLVFVLREDYLSYLERYSAHIPALKQNRYGLLPITYRQAQEIITKPREGLVSREVADAIIRQIATDEELTDDTPVDVAILSLFLSRLFEKKGVADTISMQLVTEQGDALLEDFYEEIVAPLDARTVQYLEDVLINADGHRENVTTESLYKNAWLKQATVEELERSHLLRVFSYGSVQRVEFAHDVLCPIVVRRRSQRANLSRLKRSQRMGIAAFFALVLIVFGAIYISLLMGEKEARLQAEREQLSEMDYLLLEKTTDDMLKKHDIYGAIRLLINSMPEDLSNPSFSTAAKEALLRRAVDSLYYSKDPVVAVINYYVNLPRETDSNVAVSSASGRLVGFNDNNGATVIIDSNTGAIVHIYSKENYGKNIFAAARIRFERSQRYLVGDGFIGFWRKTDHSVIISDIASDDTRCLIIADDTTVLDCFIPSQYTWMEQGTRLCLHDFHKPIRYAAYSANNEQIAVMTKDGTYFLFESKTGKLIPEAEAAKQILDKGILRQRCRWIIDNPEGGHWQTFDVNDSMTIQCSSIEITVCKKRNILRTNEHLKNLPLFIPTDDEIAEMHTLLDSVTSISESYNAFSRYYYWDEEEYLNHGDNYERYVCPIAINKNKDRVIVEDGMSYGSQLSYIYGVYPANAGSFFGTYISKDVQSIHFSDDDRYLILDVGTENERVIYLPPLEELVQMCKDMFFNWEMSEDERVSILTKKY